MTFYGPTVTAEFAYDLNGVIETSVIPGEIRVRIGVVVGDIPDRPVVATGGDAPLITRDLPEITKLAPLLTLDGLRIIACLNF